MLKNYLRKLKFLIIRLFRIKDNAHGIAMGFTIGLITNFVPSFGTGPFLSVGAAKLFKSNPVAGFIGAVSIVWAFPFCFYLNILVGERVFPIDNILEEPGLAIAGLSIGLLFIKGMIINMILFGTVTYYLVYSTIKKHRNFLLMFVHKNWIIQKQ